MYDTMMSSLYLSVVHIVTLRTTNTRRQDFNHRKKSINQGFHHHQVGATHVSYPAAEDAMYVNVR